MKKFVVLVSVFLLAGFLSVAANAAMDVGLETEWRAHFDLAGDYLDQRIFDKAKVEVDGCTSTLARIREDMQAKGENPMKDLLYSAYHKFTLVYASFIELDAKGGNPVKAIKNKKKLKRVAAKSKKLLKQIRPVLVAEGKTGLVETCDNCEREMTEIFVRIRNIPNVG